MSTSSSRPAPSTFRQRFMAGEHLVGTFIKTPTTHAIEILGALGFDFVVIDEEHAPFARATIDLAILAARAAGTAGIVRIANLSSLQSVLDCGATGVLVPHVATAAKAREVAAACHYRGGHRGFSSTSRLGSYGGSKMWQIVETADATTTVIAMIEDSEALEQIDAILAVDGLDGLFIGRNDLSVSLGAAGDNAPPVQAAVERILAAARAVKKPVCILAGSVAEAQSFKDRGVNTFLVSSDQGFMRSAATRALADLSALNK